MCMIVCYPNSRSGGHDDRYIAGVCVFICNIYYIIFYMRAVDYTAFSAVYSFVSFDVL